MKVQPNSKNAALKSRSPKRLGSSLKKRGLSCSASNRKTRSYKKSKRRSSGKV